MKILSRLTLFLLITLFTVAGHAQKPELETTKYFGDYEVHYSVLNTSFIPPEAGKAYNIVRSGDKALMNVSVLKRGKDGIKKPVTAAISGTESDLIHKIPLTFKEVKEEYAIYYLAVFDIRHKTEIFYSLKVQPEGEKSPIKVDFSRTLYKDKK